MTQAATRILLVEDNVPDARLIAELLRESGEPLAVAHCACLAEAEAYLRSSPPEAVLLDLSLPDSHGLPTIERILTAAPALPVLVLTGLEDEQLAAEAIDKGAEDYLIKGETSGRNMVRAIHYAIQRKRIDRQQREMRRRLDLLVRTSLGVIAARNVENLLRQVVDAARTLTDARLGVAGHGYVEGTFRIQAASRADDAIPCPPGEVFKVARGGVYLDLFHSHETIRLTGAELARHPRWRGLPEGHVPLRGLLAVRLINAAGAVNSVIMLSDKVHGDFSEEDEALLEQLAAVASLAMQHIEARTDAEHAAQAKGRFLANMSHELRTPMNAILGMTDLALAEDLSPSVRDCLQTAKESAELLLEMLGEILDFSRIEAEKLQLESTPFRLRQVLDQTLRPLALRAREKGIELACDVPAAVPDRLVGDTLRLRQILVNLVGNAVKFTPQGEVVVRVKEEGSEIGDWGLGKGDARPSGSEETAEAGRRQSSDEPPRSEVASLISQIPNPQSPIPNPPPPQVTLHFTVQDTGIGISAEDQQRIFAPFTQADASTTRQFGGTGLGLAIANSLVGLMGGRLWVHSGVGRGSTFHFTVQLRLRQGPRDEPADPARRQLGDLPVLPAEKNSAMPAALGRVAPPAAPAVRAPAALAARPLRVLLAEDTLSSQKVVVRILQRRGHTVQVADTGARAVELVRGHEFDVVLMDVQMPAMDGLEATRHIRRLEDSGKARLPVVAMTAHAMRGDRERCLEAGVDAYLAKPIHADELIAMVEQMAAGGGPRKASGPSRAGAGPETASEPETPFHAAEALARCAGQREILTEMVSFYQDNIRAWINELRAAAAAGSAAELARLGHRLRSTLIYLAAHRAEALAGQVEQLGASGDLGGAAAALEELTVALGDLEAGLRQFSP